MAPGYHLGVVQSMQSVLMFWRLLLLMSTFLFPQLVGVLLHFRLVRRSRWLACALGLLVPALLFFYLGPLLFFAGLREAQQNGEVTCGMPALAAALLVLAGTAAQVIVALPIQLYLFSRQNRLKI